MKIPLNPPFLKGEVTPPFCKREVGRDLRELFNEQMLMAVRPLTNHEN